MIDSVPIEESDNVMYSSFIIPREASMTPIRMRDRLVAQFMSPQNRSYLTKLMQHKVPPGALREHAVNSLDDAMYDFSRSRALEVIASDPIARRGAARPSVDFWDELRRINRVFYEERMSVMRDYASVIEEPSRRAISRETPRGVAIRDGLSEDNEQYHMRAFISDSLRPPGLENLNTPGPSYELLEDQSTSLNAYDRHRRNKPKCGAAQGAAQSEHRAAEYDEECFSGDWKNGNPNRTSDQAIAEYWGDDKVATQTFVGQNENTTGRAYGDDSSWGTAWKDNGGTRFMRYESIPFWQKGGREGYDTDIDETLGLQMRESNSHVRGWDMERLKIPSSLEKYMDKPHCAEINKYVKPPGQTYR